MPHREIKQVDQMMQVDNKERKKYTMNDFISPVKSSSVMKSYDKNNSILYCICKFKDHRIMKCIKCCQEIHICLDSKPNRGKSYECCSCLSKALDPLFQVRRTFIQSYFTTESIFQTLNQITFQFVMNVQDMGFPVQVRGLKPECVNLNWPMQGGFCLNDDPNLFHEFKPLLSNSNRKTRRQQYFSVPKQKLKIGKNYLKFKIYKLDRERFQQRFQFQQRGLYFFSINSICKVAPEILITETFRERRTQKQQSLRFLQMNTNDVQITSNKLCLTCPYTKQRIKIPVRGKYCNHFNCICLETLIATHINFRHWSCPLCDCQMNEPYVDLWIYNMLKYNRTGENVIVNQDGTYKWESVKQQVMDLDQASEISLQVQQTIHSHPKVISQRPLSELMKDISIQPQKQGQPLITKEFIKNKQKDNRKQLVQTIKNKIQFLSNHPQALRQDPPNNMEKTNQMVNNTIVYDVKSLVLKEMKREQHRQLWNKSKVIHGKHKIHLKNSNYRNLFKDLLK